MFVVLWLDGLRLLSLTKCVLASNARAYLNFYGMTSGGIEHALTPTSRVMVLAYLWVLIPVRQSYDADSNVGPQFSMISSPVLDKSMLQYLSNGRTIHGPSASMSILPVLVLAGLAWRDLGHVAPAL